MTESSDRPAIRVRGLRHRFRGHDALTSVDFTVGRGSIHAFVGPNGAGKTTTLKVLATLLRPDHGDIQVLDMDLRSNVQNVRRAIGYMPDHFGMYRQMKVAEYLDFFAAAYGQGTAQRRTTIDDVLALTDMGGRRDDLIKNLSRGMQQRVSLARALVHDPKVLLLDEPASGLDPRARIELIAILEELRNLGKSIFISSHILSELATLCDAVTIIDRGVVKYSGSMQELLHGSDVGGEYTIQLAQPDDGLPLALTGLPGVTGAEETARAEYRVRFATGAPDTTAVLRLLVEREVELVAFQRSQRRLDQVFLDLTSPGVGA